MPIQSVHYERYGPGTVRLTATVEPASLSPDEVRRLEELVEAANFFSMPAMLRSARPEPDQFRYVVTIEREDKRHTVRADAESLSSAQLELFQFLDTLAVEQHRRRR
jgi:hypothetical protein